MSSLDYLDLCRLCLVKDRVSVPIFEGEGDVRQIFLKITACLPVKVAREDKLPKKICDDCVYKVELIYQFWHTTANAEKQLLQWLGEVNMEDKQGYNVLNPNGMKPEQSNENRLDGTVMQQVSEHQNNMTMGMMDNMGLAMPMMMSSSTQQQITSVPIDNSGSSVQNVQPVAGPSTQTTHDQITQNQTNTSTQQDDEEESSEEEENSDDECDGDEGLPIKEESEEDPNSSRTIEPTTFVNVSLACDEAGPSGLQQQKIADMPEMVMSQTSDVDPKTGFTELLELDEIKIDAIKIEGSLREANALFMETTMNAANEINSIESSKENKDVGSSSYDHYTCNICAFPCQTKGSLIRHMQLHEHTCSICNGLFESSKKLQTHMALSHGEAKYLCKLCNTTLWSKPDLRKHFMTKHLDPFCNTCNICNQEFQTMYAITTHMHHSHSSISVICTICKREFASFTALRLHNKHVHLKSGFQCGICGRRDIFSVVDLETHLRRHRDKQRVSSQHVCTTCGQCFDKKPHLTEHMIKCHGKTNPYVCPVCKKSFEKRSNQIQHILTHMHNVYACDICGARFPRRSTLICHRKMHPGPLGPLPIIPVTGIVSKFVRDYLSGTKGLSDP